MLLKCLKKIMEYKSLSFIGMTLAVSLLLNTDIQAQESNAELSQSSPIDINRSIDVISVEHKGDHRIRVFFSATEKSGQIRYPISTIERNMVSVSFRNISSPPQEAKSLAVLGSQSTDLNRALFVAFNLDRTLTAREIVEVRERISELITELPAQYLYVSASAQDSFRTIADTTPDKNDNINRIQQQIAALQTEGEGPALSEILCSGAEKFKTWPLDKFKRSDQKIMIIVSPSGDTKITERFRAENCWRSLIDQKVRVFHVSFGKQKYKSTFDLKAVIEASRGFVHEVSSPLDILAASKNIIGILKNEYVLDVEAPDISLEDQPLELSVKVSYHNSIMQSDVYNLGFVIPTLSSVFGRPQASNATNDKTPLDLQKDIEFERKLKFGIYVLVLIAIITIIFFMFRYLKKRNATRVCGTCNLRVKKDFSNCAFRATDCVARLIFVSGPKAGQMIPLRRGPNRVSVFSRQGAQIPRGGIRWFNHGTIVADGSRATYTPKKMGQDLINGWPVHETKMLGQGHVLKMGKHVLRFEIKPSSMNH